MLVQQFARVRLQHYGPGVALPSPHMPCTIAAAVQDYLSHNIPVGALNVDSRWETNFNDFVWDTEKFPNATDMVRLYVSTVDTTVSI
jgi:glycosyl hydrolase family 31